MYRFRYIYASDGNRGFLLDEIREPHLTKLRLLWCNAGESTIQRAVSKRSPARAESGRDAAGTPLTTFDETEASSEITGLEYEIHFALEADSERFGPWWVPLLLPGVPKFHSKYGRLKHGTLFGVSLEALPLGFSWYSVRNLALARWLLVSALEFSGTDLRVELCAVRVANLWLGSLVFRYQGVTHRLTGASGAFRVNIIDAGRLVDDKRRFSAELSLPNVSLELVAEAPLADFVLLESHGRTNIETTLFGSCEVSLRTGSSLRPVTHRATRTCLLELKS